MKVAAAWQQLMWLRFTATGACIVAGAFHARLLVGQFLDGDLTDASRVVRWLIAAGIAAALIALAQRGESVVGRKAVAAWALAALLHGPALADTPAFRGAASLPEAVISLLQVTLAGAALGLLVLGAVARRARRPLIAGAWVRRPVRGVVAASGFARAFAARPPPFA